MRVHTMNMIICNEVSFTSKGISMPHIRCIERKKLSHLPIEDLYCVRFNVHHLILMNEWSTSNETVFDQVNLLRSKRIPSSLTVAIVQMDLRYV